MSKKHATRKWTIRPEAPNDLIDENGQLVATVYPAVTADGYTDQTSIPQAEANARHIVHCVKCHDELVDVLLILEKRCTALGWSDAEMRIIRHAITKATGEAPLTTAA